MTSIDVDIVTPKDAIVRFVPFVKKHYAGKYHLAGRSIGIELSYVDLDSVVTAAPSEAARTTFSKAALAGSDTLEHLTSTSKFGKMLEAATTDSNWRNSPLCITDRDVGQWQRTHPLAQISWTWAKNRKCGGHYVNVLKALKW